MRWWWLIPEWLQTSLNSGIGNWLVIGLLLILGFLFFRRRAQKYPTVIHGTWGMLIEGLQMSPKNFYTLLTSSIEKREVPGGTETHIEWPEGGPLSPRREYLRIRRKQLVFDICAAPFGTGFFVSWWLGETLSVVLYLLDKIPYFGPPLVRYFHPDTYYRIDTASMFRTAIHQAVLDTVNGLNESKGLPRVSDLDSKPILREFFRR